MSDMRDWYYRQKVLEDELDGAFGALETADWRVIADLGLCRHNSEPGVYGGIAWGFNAMHLSGLDIYVNSGAAYREDGKRTGTATNLTVNTAYTGSCPIGQGGHGDGTTVLGAPGDVGKECIVSIFLAFDRLLSDERYDGYNQKVYFKRNESFHFYLTMGAHKLIADPGAPVPPARETDGFLIADVRLQNAAGTVTFYSISQTRREWMINLAAINTPHRTITTGRIREALNQLLEYYNEHINGNADRHPANDIDFAPTQVWADGTGGTYGAATVVGNAINDIVIDLSQVTEVAGAKRVGARAQTGSLTAPGAGSPLSLLAGTLESQLTAIMNAVNGRVFRGGDDGIGLLAPAIDGTAFGTAIRSWDAFLRDITVKGAVKSHLIPGLTFSYDLGTTASRWENLWLHFLHVTDIQACTATFSGDVGIDANLTVTTGVTDVQMLTAHDDAMFHSGAFGVDGAYADIATSLTITPKTGGLGLKLNPLDGSSGGWLATIGAKCKLGGPLDWLKLDRLGAAHYGPLFSDNFQYWTAGGTTNTLADILPVRKWHGANYFAGGGGFRIAGMGRGKFVELRAHAGEAASGGSPRSIYIESGGQWRVGGQMGLMCAFTITAGSPCLPGEYCRAGFIGYFYDFEATIRWNDTTAYAFFNSGTEIRWGAVNLFDGVIGGTFYDFRIVVVSPTQVWVTGPGGNYEMLTTTAGINSSETCNWQCSVDSFVTPTGDGTLRLHDVWANECDPGGSST